MSCSSCSGSADCHADRDRPTPTGRDLLLACQKLCAKGELMAETEEVLQTFNDLGFAVARGRARSLEALATVFNHLGAQLFTEACSVLLQLDCTGDLVAMAYAHCDAQPTTFHRRLVDKSSISQLVEEVNLAARRHELVPGNPTVGRAKGAACHQSRNPQASVQMDVNAGQLSPKQAQDYGFSPSPSTSGTHPESSTCPERWWIGPWVGSVVLAWAATMWWTQRQRPTR